MVAQQLESFELWSRDGIGLIDQLTRGCTVRVKGDRLAKGRWRRRGQGEEGGVHTMGSSGMIRFPRSASGSGPIPPSVCDISIAVGQKRA